MGYTQRYEHCYQHLSSMQHGKTPLLRAIKNSQQMEGSAEIVEILVKAGANLEEKDEVSP